LISASRSVIYASAGENFAEAAREAAIQFRDQINQVRQSI
jgi:orotidine-5'-phosphate decarboxylase